LHVAAATAREAGAFGTSIAAPAFIVLDKGDRVDCGCPRDRSAGFVFAGPRPDARRRFHLGDEARQHLRDPGALIEPGSASVTPHTGRSLPATKIFNQLLSTA